MTAWLPRTRTEWLALLIGAAALIACGWLGTRAPLQALLSYLFAFFFFTGLSAGSLALLMVHALTGGAWGWYSRAPLLAAARVLPLMALAVIPLLVCMRVLYPWTASTHDAQLHAQSWYLADTFFVIRTIVYFALWLGWLFAFQRALDDPVRLRRIAAPGLIVFALTTLVGSTDWILSLTPRWHSSVFGMMVGTGWILIACALAVLCACMREDADAHPPHVLHDLGNLLLALVLAWAYLVFMQYLTVWIADLPDENAWYIPRTLTSWRYLAWFLIAFHFVIPFFVLLSREAKRRRRWLGTIAAMLLIADLADAFWLVVPSFRAQGFLLRWSDLCAPLGLGALWLCVYLCQLRVIRLPAVGHARATTEMKRSHG
ncbi:MAG TPA: hypothetical protein VJ727_01025 [Rhodanobacteraceae bacterium]|nr:hypothetical protein [Rhodanobacteraceae bacterium]